ncbi:hypothetical protein EDB80DRAFT_677308 [Ilyonectria destructans]|nr:hypothetical protein EDB80DRAFT_677308 [Ilyonectria destructans]
MGGQAGLKCLQWMLRGVQLCAAALILAVYTYFLATLAAYRFHISTQIRAVEGISGSAVLYCLLGLLLICCIGGNPMASFIAVILDVAFMACFIYIAVANKHGAGNCRGEVNTPYGIGLAKSKVKAKKGGSLVLPSYRVACQLQTACVAAAIIIIILLLISMIINFALARSHYEKSRTENKGYGYGEGNGFLGRTNPDGQSEMVPDDLPPHTQLDEMRDSLSPSISSHTSRGISDDYELHPRVPNPPYPV